MESLLVTVNHMKFVWDSYIIYKSGKILQLDLRHTMRSRARVLRSHDLVTVALHKRSTMAITLPELPFIPNLPISVSEGPWMYNACVINLRVLHSSHASDIYAVSFHVRFFRFYSLATGCDPSHIYWTVS